MLRRQVAVASLRGLAPRAAKHQLRGVAGTSRLVFAAMAPSGIAAVSTSTQRRFCSSKPPEQTPPKDATPAQPEKPKDAPAAPEADTPVPQAPAPDSKAPPQGEAKAKPEPAQATPNAESAPEAPPAADTPAKPAETTADASKATDAPSTDAAAAPAKPAADEATKPATDSSTESKDASSTTAPVQKDGGDATPPKAPEDERDIPPRGFEHFYDARFSKQKDADPADALKGVSQAEEIQNAEVDAANRRRRRATWALVGLLTLGTYVVYAGEESNVYRWIRARRWFVPNTSVAAIDAAFARMLPEHIVAAEAEARGTAATAEDGEQAAPAEGEEESPETRAAKALAKIRLLTDYVSINLDTHTAGHFDAKGNLLGITTFADVTAFKDRVRAWIVKRTKTVTAEVDGETITTTTETTGVPDIFYSVPSYFPFAAIAFLWLLPVLVTVHSTLTMQVRAAGMAASKGPASKPSRFKLQKDITTKLQDVAGLTEVKLEVTEIVHMLKHPANYTRLGARVPRGVLIDGPPGVGKTLLAKAVAGEANLPFVSASGSEFDEVYVGVGAKRVRELFAMAKKNKPCVIFIDEIDTFGRKRRNDRSGSSRATINALLNELDGFTESSEVMVLAATNRADTLDEALTRSGRFDRKISVDMPPHKDRVEIAKVHLKPLTLATSLKLDAVAETLATMTPGCSGADIYNICNEAAITASRLAKDAVDIECFYAAMDRIMMGMEKKAKKLSPTERERLAFHEAGHVVLAWFLETTDPVLKASIAPRGGKTSGTTKSLPKDRYISTQHMLREKMVQRLGGYVAEEYFFEDVSSGAADDLRHVTSSAHHEVATYGMAPSTIGHFGWPQDENAIQKPYSNAKAEAIDKEVHAISDAVLGQARQLLREHLGQVRVVAGLLLKNETVNARDLYLVLGERPKMTPEFRTYLETAAS